MSMTKALRAALCALIVGSCAAPVVALAQAVCS